MPLFCISAINDFSYDKIELSENFSEIDLISNYIDQNEITFNELSKNHLFEGNIELTNQISVKPNLKFEDVDWGAFAWGFCCFPVGIFTVLINDKKDQKSKDSLWAGLGASSILSSLAYFGVYTYLIMYSYTYY